MESAGEAVLEGVERGFPGRGVEGRLMEEKPRASAAPLARLVLVAVRDTYGGGEPLLVAPNVISTFDGSAGFLVKHERDGRLYRVTVKEER